MASNVRAYDRKQLHSSFDAILDRSRDLVRKSSTKELQHMVIIKAREEMGSVLDKFLDAHCSDQKYPSEQKALVSEAWKVFVDYLFNLNKVDMHNACYTSNIMFPDVIYD